MTALYLVLLAAAAVCFLLSAFGRAAPKVDLLSAGLFLWVLVPLIQHVQRVS